MPKPRVRIMKRVFLVGPADDPVFFTGTLLEDHHSNPMLTAGSPVRSSRIVNMDEENGEIETLNTIYVLEDE